MEKVKKYLPYVWMGLPGVAAIVMFVVALMNQHTAVKVLLFISVALLVILAGLIALYYLVFAEKRRNYFLTDRETGKNIRVSDLDFVTVNDRMNIFMAKRVSSQEEMWLGGFLGKKGLFGANDIFKPLAIYKMFFDLSEINTEECWHLFYKMPDADFARMINCLESVADLNMSRKLTSLRRISDGTETVRTSEFIIANRRYIQNRMITYVTAHIKDFDEAKKS